MVYPLYIQTKNYEKMAENLTISTISKYFGSEIFRTIESKLNVYKGLEYPLEVCLSTIYDGGTLLGTLTFVEVVDAYPTYIGDVISDRGETLSTTLNHSIKDGIGIWRLILTPKDSGLSIRFDSLPTTSIDPTLVTYEGITAPTSGACVL